MTEKPSATITYNKPYRIDQSIPYFSQRHRHFFIIIIIIGVNQTPRLYITGHLYRDRLSANSSIFVRFSTVIISFVGRGDANAAAAAGTVSAHAHALVTRLAHSRLWSNDAEVTKKYFLTGINTKKAKVLINLIILKIVDFIIQSFESIAFLE